VPAALAAGERFGISGTHFLRAVTLGYDIGPRFTMTLVGQQFEARVTGARTASLHCSARQRPPVRGEPERCANAISLGYTAHQSSGLGAWNRDTSTSRKHFTLAA